MPSYALPAKLISDRIADGDAYVVSKIQDISGDGSVNTHIRNPHADKLMWLAGISIHAENNVEFYLHDTFDSITDGTEIIIQNALMDTTNGGPDSGPFEAYYGSTFTIGSNGTVPLGFTSSDGATESKGVNIHPTAVEPDRQIVIELQNQDSSVNKSIVSLLLVTSY